MARDEKSGKTTKSPAKTSGARSAKSSKSTSKASSKAPAPSARKAGQETDAIALLKADHRAMEKLFADYEKATSDTRKEAIIAEVATMLKVHAELEEAVFYPALREATDEDDALDEAQVEHDTLKILLADLESGKKIEFRDAKVKVLSEYVEHHVKEEESSDGLFEQGRKSGLDMMALGEEMAQLRAELEEDPSRLSEEPVSIAVPAAARKGGK